MKNIHILPTDKPSRIRIGSDGLNLSRIEFIEATNKHHIYITSDEEIKEGDWCIDDIGDIFKIEGLEYFKKFCKKIILTDNKDIIKDNVQNIPDEFLEWFVKNSSCERVEVKPLLSNNGRALFGYKIIIPKEEPKKEPVLKCDLCKTYPRLEGTNKCESCYSVVRHFLEQDPEFKGKLLPDLRKKQETLEESLPKNRWKYTGKQETIEEARASSYINFAKSNEDISAYSFVAGWDKGASWQQEQDSEMVSAYLNANLHNIEVMKKMYSEEEVYELIDLLKRSITEINHIKFTYKDAGHCVKYLNDCETTIKQFKKK